jgi:DNA invertase Pin-like site-specific DNA recombinase
MRVYYDNVSYDRSLYEVDDTLPKDYDRVVEDFNLTDTAFSNRPGGEMLLQLVNTRSVKTIIVPSITALGTEIGEVARVIAFFNDNNVEVRYTESSETFTYTG